MIDLFKNKIFDQLPHLKDLPTDEVPKIIGLRTLDGEIEGIDCLLMQPKRVIDWVEEGEKLEVMFYFKQCKRIEITLERRARIYSTVSM